MADAATVRSAVKSRLGLTDSTWDSQIDGFVTSAVSRLYPRAKLEVDSQEVLIGAAAVTYDSSQCEATIDLNALTTAIREARQVEGYNGYSWELITDTYHHGSKLRLRRVSSSYSKLRFYGLKQFAQITDVYDWLLQAIYWYAMAEFYDMLASNKSKYNTYLQQSGARAVDNMRDESLYYESRADAYIEQQNQEYGQ